MKLDRKKICFKNILKTNVINQPNSLNQEEYNCLFTRKQDKKLLRIFSQHFVMENYVLPVQYASIYQISKMV